MPFMNMLALALALLCGGAMLLTPESVAGDARASHEDLRQSQNGVTLKAPHKNKALEAVQTPRQPNYDTVKKVERTKVRASEPHNVYSVKEQKRREYIENEWLTNDEISLVKKAYNAVKTKVDLEDLSSFMEIVKEEVPSV